MGKQHFERVDENFLPNEKGSIFVGPNAVYDLSSVQLLYSSVDTLRQLYKLQPNEELLEVWSDALEDSASREAFVFFAGHEWLLRRGGKSGFQFLLQNAESGLILLVKSNYAKVENSATHFKIEVSPKLLSAHCPDSIQIMLDDLAEQVSSDGDYQPAGVAIHLALDVQGWEAPSDLDAQLVCRSRRVSDRNGFTELVVDGTGVAAVYGKGQSFCFGSASSLQFAVYNKSKEMLVHDKADYFEQQWRRYAAVDEDFNTVYDPESSVWRLEARFSHTVVNQFAETNNVKLKQYKDIYEHLGGLWRYALSSFRLDHNRSYVAPIWTLFTTDADFRPPSESFDYRRTYKTPGVGNEKNVCLALGNMLSLFARNGVTAQKAWAFLKRSGIWADLMGYCKARKISRGELYEAIEDGLKRRRLVSKVTA